MIKMNIGEAFFVVFVDLGGDPFHCAFVYLFWG